jgi:hypothetical protein
MKINPLILIVLLFGCTPVSQSSLNSASNPKVLSLSDKTYEEPIRTVILRPGHSEAQAYLEPAVTALGNWNLLLEFDDLSTQRDNYYAKIIHCNFDWSKSVLMDLDFMEQFNEFPINNFEFSSDTHVPYVHYWIQIPPVKIPGNYVVIVYRGGDRSDLILSKRFMVYDKQVVFQNERSLVGAGALSSLNQQINFTVNYRNLEIVNPMENVKVVIRQNQRWDNMALDVKPSFVREIERQIEYRFFDDAKMFKGGNEFRFFDLRSLNNPGRNVGSVDRSAKPFEVFIQKDKPRTDEAYSQYPDYNGGYIPDNLDYNTGLNFTNYSFVNFTLASRKRIHGDVYVTGGFHQWNLDKENKMSYDSVKREYSARLFLKQGWYDYQYVVKSSSLPYYHIEGSHFETENYYEIFVYYRPFQPKADLLIGYQRLTKNER